MTTLTFSYDPQICRNFPALVTAVAYVQGIPSDPDVADLFKTLEAEALNRLGDGTEADLPAIRAWRAAYSTMGLKPTQYRCASEALLRRMRKEGSLPRLHPFVDVCNAVSAAYSVPVAAFDLDRIDGDLTVRAASGEETYVTFGGQIEHPAPGEIVFGDAAGVAHARRWVNRQSAVSAVSPATRNALVVIEALHDDAEKDVTAAVGRLTEALRMHGATVQTGLIRGGETAFEIHGAPP